MLIEKILVVENDLIVRRNFEQQLHARGYDVAGTAFAAQARELLRRDHFDLMFVDGRLPDGEAIDLLKSLQTGPQPPIIVIIADRDGSAVRCMQHGAFGYVSKSFSSDQIDVTLEKAERFVQCLKVSQHLSREEEREAGDAWLGRSSATEQLRALVRQAAPSQRPVLIHGEAGTSLEAVARALHREGPRPNAPFIRVDCAAIPEELMAGELFGREKSPSPGASTRREGRFELAHGGTLLLDEIGVLPAAAQAGLLRVLQEGEFERVGGKRTIRVDARVIATTSRRLDQSQEFRRDLFSELSSLLVAVPPLRARHEDIALLAEHFLERFARRHGLRIRGLSGACLEALRSRDWPGNDRELQQVLERAVILCGDGELEPEHVGLAPQPRAPAARVASVDDTGELLTVRELEKRQIFLALARCNGNRTHAAKKLGISIRTLRNKLHQYGVAGKKEELTEEAA